MTRCTSCNAPLAHDQRYCVECGARRGLLPELVAAMIVRIEGHNDAALDPELRGAGPSPVRPLGGWMPSPRAAALAVMGMLAFGAEIGAVVGASGGAALASGPLILLRHSVSPAPAVTSAADLGSGSSAAGGGVRTITIPAPSSPGGGGSAAAAAPGQAAAPASTTTTSTTTTTATTPSNPYGLPDIKHVFVIMLGDQGYSQTFGSLDPYMGKTLPKQGKLIETYYAVAGGELANQIALISGQGPTPETAADCPMFTDIAPGTTGKQDQVLGDGCLYPHSTATLASQLTAAHLKWKAYIQGMASTEPGEPQSCRHPTVGTSDPNQTPQPGDPYVTWRDPFVYFHSVIDASACQHDVVDLSQLSTDLTNTSTTPNFSYIVPNLCDDGSDQPCTPGATAGVASADSFLRTTVAEITSSAAYQAGGLIVITFDQAPQSGQDADSSSCCATPRYPNLPVASSASVSPSTPTTTTAATTTTAPATKTSTTSTTTAETTASPPAPTTSTTTTPASTPTTTSTTTTTPAANLGTSQGGTTSTGGGGQVGLLMISPWVKAGTTDVIDDYNHFSLLESIEDIFDLKHLGYAKASGLPAFDASTFDGKGPSGG
ncbi:MAG: alkaline phosphatase family protein [Solirubrobacteraceae bacterium]